MLWILLRVPRIIRVSDSLGNVYDNPTDGITQETIFTPKQELRYGDTYSVNVDIDTSFSENEYDITWKNQNHEIKEFRNHKRFIITFGENDISQTHTIACTIVSHKPWHMDLNAHRSKIGLWAFTFVQVTIKMSLDGFRVTSMTANLQYRSEIICG